MTTSVCMGMYNGEKYIEQQLQSILKQSKPVDEVVLCDDGSSDGTIDIVKQFIRINKLENKWKLYQNQENKGYPENFYYVMSLCTQDVVFLADQDDIWDIHKVEMMCDVLENHPEANVVCCKFGLIDADGQEIRSVMAPVRSRETKTLRNVTIEDVFYKCEWPGMVLAYRREWYRQCMLRWKNDQCVQNILTIPHDFLICAWAAEENGFMQMDMELAWHRRHDNNTGGEEHRIRKLLNRKRKLLEIEKYCGILGQFKEINVLFTEVGKKALYDKCDSMQGRYNALKSGKVGSIIGNAWKNRIHVRLATAFCDVLIAIID